MRKKIIVVVAVAAIFVPLCIWLAFQVRNSAAWKANELYSLLQPGMTAIEVERIVDAFASHMSVPFVFELGLPEKPYDATLAWYSIPPYSVLLTYRHPASVNPKAEQMILAETRILRAGEQNFLERLLCPLTRD